MTARLTILVKGLILIAVPLFFQLAFIALVASMRDDALQAEVWTIHTKDVITLAQKCRLSLLTAHGAIQGYTLTRDSSFEQDLSRSVDGIPKEILALKAFVYDNPPQVEAASKILDRANAFVAFLIDGRGLVLDNRMDISTAVDRRRQSQAMLDAINQDFDTFLAVEEKLDQIRHDRLTHSWTTLNRLLVGGITLSVLFTVGLAVVYSKNISGRIVTLTENAHRLARGQELSPPIRGSDEIARLDQVFHEMARTLAQAAGREREHAGLLERRAEELALVNSQLNEKARENEMFVYSVSHDLRSPLINLQGFGKELGLIGGDLARLVDHPEIPVSVKTKARAMIEGDMAESISFIQTAVTRLSAIIDALLRLSRAGRVEYRQQEVDVASIVDRVVTALRGTIVERSATVHVGELPTAWGDPTAIEQVFANLIGNALNYLDRRRPGLVEVFAIDPTEQTVLIEGVADGSVVFAVRDNGLGISDSYKSKVFTAFQRLHGNVAKGEGIGLALVRRMVERHGGRVWFESVPGQGSTFFVAFPVPEIHSGSDQNPMDRPSAMALT